MLAPIAVTMNNDFYWTSFGMRLIRLLLSETATVRISQLIILNIT